MKSLCLSGLLEDNQSYNWYLSSVRVLAVSDCLLIGGLTAQRLWAQVPQVLFEESKGNTSRLEYSAGGNRRTEPFEEKRSCE